jgi:hypothetical protein
MVNAPSARRFHSAVWTGTEMIIWGGFDGANQLSSGGIYDPGDDAWSAMTASTSARREHSAVWSTTDQLMLIYGGYGDAPALNGIYFPSGGAAGGEAYDPLLDSWSPLTLSGQPSARMQHKAVFDGDDMILWGGYDGGSDLATGAQYVDGTWLSLTGTAPQPRHHHTAVWVSSVRRMIVWGGQSAIGWLATGGEFDPDANEWLVAPPTALEAREFHTAVATGNRMIVWGGRNVTSQVLNTGGVYTPAP